MSKSISFEMSRKEMLEEMIKNSSDDVITKTIPFTNDDVPKFIESLNAFDEASKNSKLMF